MARWLEVPKCSPIVAALAALMAACAARPTATEPTSPKATPSAEGEAPAPFEPIVELPRSPMGQLARALVDVINGGKAADQREFVRAHFSDKALKETPLEDWVAFLQRTWQSSAGVEVVGGPPPRGPNRFPFEVRTRKGRRYSLFVIEAAHPEDGRIDMIFANPLPNRAALQKGALVPVAMREADAVRAMSQRVEQLGAADEFSGVVLVLQGDRVLVSIAQGQADKAFAAPNRIDTKFNLGSMNKMFTAISIGQLVEKGKLAFTDTLAKVLPDYPNRPFAESVTIHQLLTHTSGIGGNIFAPELFEHRDRYKRLNDYLPLIAKEPAQFPPGERFSYANTGFVVLGAVIERLSGEDYFDYVRTHIFAPAKMLDTASYEVDEVVPNLAIGYRLDDVDAFGILPRRTNVLALHYKGTSAGGGYSTAPDLAAFAAALRSHKLLGSAMTETITSSKIDVPSPPGPPGRRYGYGFESRTVRTKDVRGHGGGYVGIGAALHVFWDGSYTVAVMGNYDSPAGGIMTQEIVEFLAAQGEK